MHELIYLSYAKLRQFQSQSRRKLPRAFRIDAAIKAGLEFGAKIDSFMDSTQNHPTLARVLNEIDTSARPARWWQEAGLHPGEWIQFEAQLNYAVTQVEPSAEILFFWNATNFVKLEPRLLLHGSPEHLVGLPPKLPAATTARVSDGAKLVALTTKAIDDTNRVQVDGYARFTDAIRSVLNDLDDLLPERMASWMSGYARVTAFIPGRNNSQQQPLVLASPLYVAYASLPGE